MIVVDTNIITYLFIEGDNTAKAEDVLEKDSDWQHQFYGKVNLEML